jgi:hypothetical protein
MHVSFNWQIAFGMEINSLLNKEFDKNFEVAVTSILENFRDPLMKVNKNKEDYKP